MFYLGALWLSGCSPTNEQQIDASILPIIRLDISPTDMLKVRHKRERALQQGLLVSKSSDYVMAQLNYKDKELTGEVRLKGDWLDHLKGEKWSFRIKTKKQQTWNQMLTFSVQHPETRSYLKEWLYHQWLHQEEI